MPDTVFDPTLIYNAETLNIIIANRARPQTLMPRPVELDTSSTVDLLLHEYHDHTILTTARPRKIHAYDGFGFIW